MDVSSSSTDEPTEVCWANTELLTYTVYNYVCYRILATKTTSLELNQTNKSIKTNFYSAIHRERIRADVSCVDEVFYFAIALLFHKTPTVSRRLLILTVLTSCEALCLKIETRPRPSPLETEMKLKC